MSFSSRNTVIALLKYFWITVTLVPPKKLMKMFIYSIAAILPFIFFVDGNGNPTIQPVSKKELSHFREEGGKNVQMITSMCKSDWEVQF